MTEEKGTFYRNKFGNVYGEQVATPIGRAIYVYLKEPNTAFRPEKYGLSILFDKKTTPKAELNELIKKCKAVSEFVNGEKAMSYTYGPLRDGDLETNKNGEPVKNFAGCWYIKCTNAKRPRIVESRNGANVDCSPEKIMPGVQVKAVVTPLLFDSGFAWNVRLVQFVKDTGEYFFTGKDPMDLLDVLAEEEDEEKEVKKVKEVKDGEEEEDLIEEELEVVETAPKKSAKKVGKGKPQELDLL